MRRIAETKLKAGSRQNTPRVAAQDGTPSLGQHLTPMADCTGCLDPADLSAEFQQQNSVFSSQINKCVAITSPFPSILDGGTVPNNVGQLILNVVQNNAVPNTDLAQPVFVNNVDACLTIGDAIKTGETTYSTQLQTLRGKGPAVCMMQARILVENALLTALDSMQKVIAQIVGNDVRNQLLLRSGLKVNVQSGYNLFSMVNGGIGQEKVSFPSIGLPDTAMSFKCLTALDTMFRENYLCEPFGTGNDAYCVVISSKELNDRIFYESQVQAFTLSKVKGGYMEGLNDIETYAFIDGRQKGLVFGIDQQPLRFDAMTDDPLPIIIPPMIYPDGDVGKNAIPNPDWMNAKYEIGFMVYRGSFKRIVPETYTGEGTWRFPAQTVFGELKWYMPMTPDNAWGDTGYHLYQITRAYQAIYPHRVIPFIYKRCPQELGLTPCEQSLSL